MAQTCINTPSSATIKFHCSYGGKILPRYPDGILRYHGGHTRVLSVNRSISFAELLIKLGEMICGASMSLRCQLPAEDLDALVSITSDEDLANLIEEYDRAAASIKIRAFIFVPKSTQKATPATSSTVTTPSSCISNDYVSSSNSTYSSLTKMGSKSSRSPRIPVSPRPSSLCYMSSPRGVVPSYNYGYRGYGNTRNSAYLVHNGNYSQ